MGMLLKEFDLSSFTSLHMIEHSVCDTSWETIWGENKMIGDHHVRALFEASNAKHKLHIEIKTFNDGIAFRYIIPEQGMDSLNLMNELTEFNINNNPTYWWIEADYDSYERLYKKSHINEIDSAHTPLTAKFDNSKYIAIHEAALVNYASMTLKNNGTGFECNLVPWPDGVKVKTARTLTSPWRVIIIGDNAGDLIESDMILNLNQPNKLKDTDWIEPMRYMGIWWDMHLQTKTWHEGEKHGATTDYAMQMIDFASLHGFKGLLVEGWNTGWEEWRNWDFTKPYADFDIEKVQQYAIEKNMTLIGHHETGGRVSTEYEPQMQAAFEYYAQLGIKAVKTGYVGKIDNGQYHHGQWMVNHYQRVLETAAKEKIALIAHEPIKDTGLRRTWPNFLAREGVRGQEYNAWGNPSNPAEHTTIIPFTRGLAGPTDFTPGAFRMTLEEYRGENFSSRIPTTLAKQLALYVTIYSPVQMACDLPKHYQEHMDMFKFIKDVPVDWETSKVIHAEIGEYLTIARKDRTSDNWYLGSITNENGRTLNLELNFLNKNQTYKAIIYKDGENADWKSNPYEYNIESMTVDFTKTMELNLAPGGGCAIEFIALQKGEL
jgi:alpha-glucosidase